MVKIVIAGAAGRMGQALIRCSMQTDGVELIGAVEHPEHELLGRDVGVIAGIPPAGILLTSDLSAALPDADVLIDFTFHTVVPRNAALAAKLGRAVVLGTTGLTEEERLAVSKAADSVPVMWAPNMSLGVNLLFAMARKAAAVLGPSYQVVIDETHHVHKQDAPSGTALRLGENVAQGANVRFEKVMLHDEGGRMGEYPPGCIAIRSHREGEVVGDHTVSFDGAGERVTLTHHARNRDAFALGALCAAKWICTRRPRLYDMQDVLGLREI